MLPSRVTLTKGFTILFMASLNQLIVDSVSTLLQTNELDSNFLKKPQLHWYAAAAGIIKIWPTLGTCIYYYHTDCLLIHVYQRRKLTLSGSLYASALGSNLASLPSIPCATKITSRTRSNSVTSSEINNEMIFYTIKVSYMYHHLQLYSDCQRSQSRSYHTRYPGLDNSILNTVYILYTTR